MEQITEALITGKLVRHNELIVGFKDYDLNLSEYKVYLLDHLSEIKRVVLVGEDPAFYPDLPRLIGFNKACGVRTIIHTSGKNLQILDKLGVDELKDVQLVRPVCE